MSAEKQAESGNATAVTTSPGKSPPEKLLLTGGGLLAAIIGGGGLLTFIASVIGVFSVYTTAQASRTHDQYTEAVGHFIHVDPNVREIGIAELKTILERSDEYDQIVLFILAGPLGIGATSNETAQAALEAAATPESGDASFQSPAQSQSQSRQIVEIISSRKQAADPVQLDLSGANLQRQDLAGVDLSNETLRAADLSESHIQFADLSGSDLSGADLTGTDLTGTNLTGTDFADTNLSGANLTGVDLSQAKNLSQAQIDSAIIDEQTLLPPDLVISDTGSG